MSTTLIIESSTPHASVALTDASGHVEQRSFSSDRNHNALLFAPLSELLALGDRRDISLVLVGSGPGSYSGTRVGIAAAQGIGLALGCPVVALPSILAVPSAENGAACLAIGDARRGSYWTAMIEHGRPHHDPQLGEAAELELAVAHAVGHSVSVIAFEDAARFPLPESLQSAIRTEFPDATRLWQAWHAADDATRTTWRAAAAQPLYLKPPHITQGKRPRLIQP